MTDCKSNATFAPTQFMHPCIRMPRHHRCDQPFLGRLDHGYQLHWVPPGQWWQTMGRHTFWSFWFYMLKLTIWAFLLYWFDSNNCDFQKLLDLNPQKEDQPPGHLQPLHIHFRHTLRQDHPPLILQQQDQGVNRCCLNKVVGGSMSLEVTL